MKIRMQPEQIALFKRLELDQPLSAFLKHFEKMSSWPWRECWVIGTVGLVVLHFQRFDDERGEYFRIPVGMDTIKQHVQAGTLWKLHATIMNKLETQRTDLRFTTLPADLPDQKRDDGKVNINQVRTDDEDGDLS